MTYSIDELLDSPQEILDYFLLNNWFRTSDIFTANLPGKAGMIFRGQSDANWELIPSAFRHDRLKQFAPQPPIESHHLGKLHSHLGHQLHAEARAVHLFLQAADELGILTPLDYTKANHAYHLIRAALKEDENDDFKGHFPPESLEPATALAQHHGVPTRLLDWSESPLVACFFAAYGASRFSEGSISPNQEFSVIFMSTQNHRGDGFPIRIIKVPRYGNSHLLQQRGIFSNIIDANKYFLSERRWPALNDFASQTFQIHRIRLRASHADALLRELYDLNITRHSLMPTLHNAAMSFSYKQALFGKTT